MVGIEPGSPVCSFACCAISQHLEERFQGCAPTCRQVRSLMLALDGAWLFLSLPYRAGTWELFLAPASGLSPAPCRCSRWPGTPRRIFFRFPPGCGQPQPSPPGGIWLWGATPSLGQATAEDTQQTLSQEGTGVRWFQVLCSSGSPSLAGVH